ncbi:DUF5615 family PIN-like protein [Microcoleus vaginatus]|uniref:DUF5615 family PIN-like protein n=1 Tax=Microcoleus vaginatus TaxID=119532 RepID=UPI00403F429B
MSEIRLYLDEDSQDQSLLRALRARQVDVTTVNETQTEGLIDEEQLRLAASQNRVLYSHNIGDFCPLHTEFPWQRGISCWHCADLTRLFRGRAS